MTFMSSTLGAVIGLVTMLAGPLFFFSSCSRADPLYRPAIGNMTSVSEQVNNDSHSSASNSSGKLTLGPDQGRIQCLEKGVHPIPGSRRIFYHCEGSSGKGWLVYLCTCPTGSSFDGRNACRSKQGYVRPMCESTIDMDYALETTPMLNVKKGHSLKRTKRFMDMTMTFEDYVPPLEEYMPTFEEYMPFHRTFGQIITPKINLRKIECKLEGVDARLRGAKLAIDTNRIASEALTSVTRVLIRKGIDANADNFAIAQNLTHQSILENRISSAITQGLIREGNIANEMNFVRVFGTINDVRKIIERVKLETKSDMEKGFQSIYDAINRSRWMPKISKIKTAIKTFNQEVKHLSLISKKSRRHEVAGGYIDFLKSTDLEKMLRDIIHEDFAVPKNKSDISAKLVLDSLVDGYLVHSTRLTSLISSYFYLAEEELKDRNLNKFNSYMQSADSTMSRMKNNLHDPERGLGTEIGQVIDKVIKIPFINKIEGLSELALEKQADLKRLQKQITDFMTKNSLLKEPNQIRTKLNFDFSSIRIPFRSWENKTKVSYAVQLVSDKGMSKVGDWSRPYEILNKGNPVVALPPAGLGEIRFVYRRFNDEKPQLVAIINEKEQNSFRDIARDFIDAASRENEIIALREVQTLLEDGADVNSVIDNEMTPLHYAAKHGNIEVMDLLLNKTADLHAKTLDDMGALHFAVLNNRVKSISFLLNRGLSVNAKTKSLGWTPLHIAAANDHGIATQTLLKHGADVNAKDKDGLTPLHISTLQNGVAMEILLRERNLEVNARTKDGHTPLHYAAQNQNAFIADHLMEHTDAEVNAYTDDFLSPLHYAAMSNTKDTVATLIEHGASPFIFDREGSSPFHYAAFYGNKEAISELIYLDHAVETVENWKNQYATDIAFNKSQLIKLIRDETMFVYETFDKIFLSETGHSPSEIHQCTDEAEAKEIVSQSEETCMYLGHIKNFADVLTTKPSFPVIENYGIFTQVVSDYNKALQNASMNTLSWTQTDGVLESVKQAFLTAKNFEALFEKRFQTMLKNLYASSDESIEYKLSELVIFLGLVQNDTKEVGNITGEAIQKCKNLNDDVSNGVKTFNKIWQDAGVLHSPKQNENVKVFRERQDSLCNDIDTFSKRILENYNQSCNTYKEIREVRMQILHKIDHLPTQRFATTIPSSESEIIAEPLLLLESSREKDKIRNLLKNIDEDKEQIRDIKMEKRKREDLVSHYKNLSLVLFGNSTNSERDLSTLNTLTCNLQDISHIVPFVESSVQEVLLTLKRIYNLFAKLNDSFSSMINEGKAATTNATMEHTVNSINKDMYTLRCNWKGTGVYMTDLRECSKNFYIVYPELQPPNSKCNDR